MSWFLNKHNHFFKVCEIKELIVCLVLLYKITWVFGKGDIAPTSYVWLLDLNSGLAPTSNIGNDNVLLGRILVESRFKFNKFNKSSHKFTNF